MKLTLNLRGINNYHYHLAGGASEEEILQSVFDS